MKISYICKTNDRRVDNVLRGVFGRVIDGTFKIDAALLRINLLAQLQSQIDAAGNNMKAEMGFDMSDIGEVEVPDHQALALRKNLMNGLSSNWVTFYESQAAGLSGLAKMALLGERDAVGRAMTEQADGFDAHTLAITQVFANQSLKDNDDDDRDSGAYTIGASELASRLTSPELAQSISITPLPEVMPEIKTTSDTANNAYATVTVIAPLTLALQPQPVEQAIESAKLIWPLLVKMLPSVKSFISADQAAFQSVQYHNDFKPAQASQPSAATPAAEPYFDGRFEQLQNTSIPASQAAVQDAEAGDQPAAPTM